MSPGASISICPYLPVSVSRRFYLHLSLYPCFQSDNGPDGAYTEIVPNTQLSILLLLDIYMVFHITNSSFDTFHKNNNVR